MSEALKVGLIGTGMIAWSHLPAYIKHPDKLKLTALCDIRDDALKNYADKANVHDLYVDYKEMLKKADIDAVTICTSHDQHEPMVIAAAEAGKHILLEKPMGRNMAECRNMISAADKAGVIFMVGHDLRFLPHTLGIKQLIDSRELGEVRVTRCSLIMDMPGGFGKKHWLNDGEISGGGILLSGVIHQVDLMRYYIGNIKSVMGLCKSIQPEYINGAEDYACAAVEYENGAIGDVLGIATPTRCEYGLSYTIYGDKGTVISTSENAKSRVEQFGPAKASSVSRDSKAPGSQKIFARFEPVAPVYKGLVNDNPFINEIVHFYECCNNGTEPITSARDNLETVKVIFGIYESSMTGKKVELANL